MTLTTPRSRRLTGAALLAAVALATSAAAAMASVDPGTPDKDIHIGKDNDNASNPFIQPPGVAAPQHMNDTDLLFGRGNADLLVGGKGGDTLLGGAGPDILVGGPDRGGDRRDDVLVSDDGDDVAVWSPGDGNDIVDGNAGTDTLVVGPVLTTAGGGMPSHARISMIDAVGATVICCTPTYALRLAEIAAQDWPVDHLKNGPVRILIVAGEPGGSIPATRRRIEESWGARVIDHHGLTEIGPVSFECWESPGFLHLNEGEYICEVRDPVTGEETVDGQPGELVITNLGRTASPNIRYRTGDIVVRRREPCGCGRTWARLEGGILARADDMINIRGVNVYPAGIESVVREMVEVVEFRSIVSRIGAMRALRMEIELAPGADGTALASRLAADLRDVLGLSIPVKVVAPGTLPRFEMKASRFVVEE